MFCHVVESPGVPGLRAARPPPDRHAIDQALRVVVLHGVRLLTGWLAPLFIVFAPLDWFFTAPAEAGHAAAILDAIVGVTVLSVFLAIRQGFCSARQANLAAGAMAGFVLPYVLLNIWFTGLPVQSAGLALWQIGICLIFLSWPWTLALLAASNVFWVAEVLWGLRTGQLASSPDWLQYGFILASSTVIGIAAHGVRLRTYRRLEGLRLEEQSRRIELEEALTVAREVDTVRRLNEIKTQFINTAAHELSTPMTPIILQLQLIRTALAKKNLSDDERQSWDVLERNILRLRTLLQDVLDSARIQADRLPVSHDVVDVGKVVYEAVAEYREAAHKAGVSLDEVLEPALFVIADAKRIHQVVANLVGNAVKFTPRGGTVKVTVRRAATRVSVEVADSGIGIRPEDRARLFAPFVQVQDAAGPVGGTGLGLYISKGIVEHSQGEIGCRSAGPAMGSTFWFTLPLTRQEKA